MVNFINVPGAFSGALGRGARCLVGGLDPAAATTVAICNAGDGELLGVKKFTGSATADVDLSRYALQLFDLGPERTGGTAGSGGGVGDGGAVVSGAAGAGVPSSLEVAAEGSVALQLECEGTTSPVMTFVLSAANPAYYVPMTRFSGVREIAWGECDEFSLVLPAGSAAAKATLTGGGGPLERGDRSAGECVPLEVELGSVEGPCVARLWLDMADIGARVAQAGRAVEDFSQVEVRIEFPGATASEGVDVVVAGAEDVAASDAGIAPIVVEYAIVAAKPDGARLCWINSLGGIDFFTFNAIARGVKSESSDDPSPAFRPVTRTLTLVSGYQTRRQIDALAGICASPRVWIACGGNGQAVGEDGLAESVGQAGGGGGYIRARVATRELTFPQPGIGNLKIEVEI